MLLNFCWYIILRGGCCLSTITRNSSSVNNICLAGSSELCIDIFCAAGPGYNFNCSVSRTGTLALPYDQMGHITDTDGLPRASAFNLGSWGRVIILLFVFTYIL